MNAIEKYNKRTESIHSLLCIGLDAAFNRIPERFKKEQFPQFTFNTWIIEQTHEYAAAYKPNVGFYEARGAKGIQELHMTVDYLKENHPNIFLIFDGKRGDIGSTSEYSAKGIFEEFGFDAATLHPYLGKDSLQPFLNYADKASIILARTSNPGAREFQDLLVDKKPLWHVVASKVVQEWNTNNNCMLVVGATYPAEMKTVRTLAGDMPFLVPGIGEQGGAIKDAIQAGQNAQGKGLILNIGRSIIFAPNAKKAAMTFRNEINLWREPAQ